jgi:hypothetical protein
MTGLGSKWGVVRIGAAISAAVAVLAICAGSAGAAGWHWAKGYVPKGAPKGFTSISCPSTNLCVAAGITGVAGRNGENAIFWTTNPTGGKASWHDVALEPDVQPAIGGDQQEDITAVSCSAQGQGHYYCAAGDGFANLWQTGAPTSGKWSSSVLDQNGLVDLSCWSVYCGILDLDSNVVVTAGAQGVNSTSNIFGLSEGASELSISCNSSRFCAAADVSKNVAWTTDEIDPMTPVWHRSSIRGNDLDRVACPNSKLCVGAEGEDSDKPQIGVSHNPGGGGGTWKSATLAAAKGGIYTVSCESASFCVAGGSKDGAGGPNGSGLIYTSTHPAASGSAWKPAAVSFPDISSISCPSRSLCVAVESNAGHIAVGRG